MKNCLECGDAFSGREDKKFCCDGCRNSFNNRNNKDVNNLMRNVNNKLRKNYRILVELNIKNKTKVQKNKLIESGFDFNFYTTQRQDKSGKTYNFIYNQGYFPLNQHLYILIKKDSQN